MSKADYALLQDVITDDDFPDLDLALRRGRHVDRDDSAWYALLTDAQELLEPFYRRYGCELIHKTDGYFYLLPTNEKVSRKQLSATDMLVGQALALLYLDPAAVERGGVVTQEEVVTQLSAVLGTDTLIAAFNPGKRKSKDERIAQRNVRQRVGEAVRRLAGLGFVELSDGNDVRLRAALLRFAEPVRGLSEPAAALAKLVAQGEVALAPDEPGDDENEDGESAAVSSASEPEETGERLARSAAADGGGAGLEEMGERSERGAAAADGGASGLGETGERLGHRAAAADGGNGIEETGERLARSAAADGGGAGLEEMGERLGHRAAAAVGDSVAIDERGADAAAAVGGEPDAEAGFPLRGQDEPEEPAYGALDETGVLRRPGADGGDVGDSSDAAAVGGSFGQDPSESVEGSAADDDGELEWANIFVPSAEKDGEDET
jgi:chromosome partition protein MukE